VSVFGYGFFGNFGSKDDLMDYDESVKKAADILRVVRKTGVNFFDNAEVYGKPRGFAEKIMGGAFKLLKEEDAELYRRSDLVISTKIFWGGDGVNEKGLHMKHVAEGMTACLERLQLDYVDAVFCHRPDSMTPTEEIVRAFTQLIRDGKAFYWGTSEWSAQKITEAYWIAKINGLIPPTCEQPQYNMVFRERFEEEYRPLYQAPYNLGTTTWSPLLSGVLTGKYNDGVPEGSRLSEMSWLKSMLFKTTTLEELVPKLRKLSAYAKEKYDTTIAVLAIAWVVKNGNVSTVLLGATKPAQIEENLKALDVARKMSVAEYKEITAILENDPEKEASAGRELKSTIETIEP
jgi:voltage-dependent potassium channel beta subunit